MSLPRGWKRSKRGDLYRLTTGATLSVWRRGDGFVWQATPWKGGVRAAITSDAALATEQDACDAAERAAPTDWVQSETRRP